MIIAISLGCAFSLLQLAACLLASGHRSLPAAYQALNQWDSVWYEHIATVGYVSTIPPVKWKRKVANVAFFPGYPMLARLVSRVLRMPPGFALLLTAQGFALVFWSLFFGVVLRATRSPAALLFLGLAVLAHPAAFYLQAGYSESLFLSMLLAFLWAVTRPTPSFLLAGGAGMVMTATRIVGAPLAFIGVAHSAVALFFTENRCQAWRALGKQIFIALASLAGIAGFFLFCQLRWGHWDLYLQTQNVGWNLTPDYLAVFEPANWSHWTATEWAPWKFNPREASRIATSLTLALLLGTAVTEAVAGFRGVKGFRDRLPFYGAATLMFYISVSGLASINFNSMIRYTLPVHVCWLIGFFMLVRACPPGKGGLLRYGLLAAGLAAMGYWLLMQRYFLFLYAHGQWVA